MKGRPSLCRCWQNLGESETNAKAANSTFSDEKDPLVLTSPFFFMQFCYSWLM